MEVLKLVLPPNPPPPFSFSNSTPPYTLMCLIVWSLPSTTQEKGAPQFPPKYTTYFGLWTLQNFLTWRVRVPLGSFGGGIMKQNH